MPHATGLGRLTRMGQEVRAPLKGVLTLLDALSGTDLDPGQEELVGRLRQSAETLVVALDDVLDHWTVEVGGLMLRYEAFDLRDLLESAVDRVDHPGVLVLATVPPELEVARVGDPERVLQLLRILIDHAARRTAEGLVEVSARAEGDQLQLSVVDHGRSLAPEQLRALFDPQDGVGRRAGLSVVRRIAEAMGGRVGVASTAASTEFLVSLHLPRRAEERAPDPRFLGRGVVFEGDGASRRAVSAQLAALGLVEGGTAPLRVVLREQGPRGIHVERGLLRVTPPVRLAALNDALVRAAASGEPVDDDGSPWSRAPRTRPPQARPPLDERIVARLFTLDRPGRPGVVHRLIALYAEKSDNDHTTLREAVRCGDPVAVANVAHSWKGSCGNLGALELADLLKAIEQHAREGRLPDHDTLAELHRRHTDSREALRDQIARVPGRNTLDSRAPGVAGGRRPGLAVVGE